MMKLLFIMPSGCILYYYLCSSTFAIAGQRESKVSLNFWQKHELRQDTATSMTNR